MTQISSKMESNEEEIVFSENAFESDSQLCIELITKLSVVSAENESQINRELEYICERFEYLINKWQMCPKLIESHLKTFLSLIIEIITNNEINSSKFHASFRLITRLISCVGYKSVSRYFPTEVFWLTKVINWCEMQNSNESNSWQTRFALLLWLSIAVKTPFHLSKFDDISGDNREGNTIVKRIYSLINKYLTVGDKSRDSAAITAGNFFSRPEIVKELLKPFMEESLEMIGSLTSKPIPTHIQSHFGHVMAVAKLFKVAHRQDMIGFASRVIEIGVKLDTCDHDLVDKWKVKLIGRSALTLLRPKVAKWRYQRGKRLLAQNLTQTPLITEYDQNSNEDLDESDFEDIPEDMELIIGALLEGLRNSSTCVRWSAAKYVARLTNRLPKELASDIVTHVLQLCEWRDSDSSWHGSCLALAELARRGLVLAPQLSSIIDVVEKALVFDEVKGSFSVGSNVRDAACFVCWSLSRAYEPHIIAEYVNRLAPTLLCVVCFDREVNCRRAASAAIQEFTGRTQIFPHGFEVLVLTDFLALANRTHCYLDIAFQLSAKPEFGQKLVEHLVSKCDHWDREVREIASQSLGKLSTVIDMNEFLPVLLRKCTAHNLNSRHGSILAVAEIVGSIGEKLNPNFINQIESIACILFEKNLLRGIGGEFMKYALNVLIAKCCLVSLPIISKNEVLNVWTEIVCDSITSEDIPTRKKAVSAISLLFDKYLVNEYELKNKVLAKLFKLLDSAKENSRIGSSESLRLISKDILENEWHKYFDLMILHMNSNDTMCYSRASEVTTLVDFVFKLGPINDERRQLLVKALCLALNDRTKDSRGDIGGNVRLAAIEASLKLINVCSNDEIVEILKLFATECVSVWQRERQLASNAFKQIVLNKDLVGIDIEQDLIKSIFEKSDDDLKAFIELLKVQTFTYDLWKGLVTSIANPTEIKIRQLLKQELKCMSDKVLKEFLNLFANSLNCDRLSYCCVSCSHFLLTVCRTDETFRSKVLTYSWTSIRGSKDVRKVVSAIDVFCAAIQLGALKQSLSYLTILLCHRYPRIRSVAANQTYVALLTIEDIDQQVINLLSETDWISSVDRLRPIRNQICDLVGIAKPIKATNN